MDEAASVRVLKPGARLQRNGTASGTSLPLCDRVARDYSMIT
jgi:hypothetical protein